MRNDKNSYSGMNLDAVLRLARQLGCLIYCPRRTGELVVAHPGLGWRVRVNGRRKDAPRALTTLVAQLARRSAV